MITSNAQDKESFILALKDMIEGGKGKAKQGIDPPDDFATDAMHAAKERAGAQLDFKQQVTAEHDIEKHVIESDFNPSEIPDQHDTPMIGAQAISVPETQLQRERIAKLQTENNRSRRRITLLSLTFAAFIVVAAIVVGSVCGTGHCAAMGQRKPVQRIRSEEWIPYVQQITLTERNVSYPPPPNATNEERALAWLVEEDNDSVNQVFAAQRYALVVLAHALNISEWLHEGFIECTEDLEGVSCDESGAVAGIELSTKSLEGTIPSDIALLSQLRRLALPQNSLYGTVPWTTMMRNMSKLVFLDLDVNDLSGSLPTPEPNTWPEIEYLWLQENSFTGPLPSELTCWSNLQDIYVRDNLLTGTVPVELAALTNMNWFNIDLNQFHGTLPSEFGNWTSLTSFEVEANSELSGTIPTEYGLWSDLRRFRTFQNKLTGTLPTEIGFWTALVAFVVDNNRFTGTIPSEIEGWLNIEGFRIGNNDLQGTLPTAISQWSLLEVIHVDNNPLLTGTIPEDVSQWTNLREAHYHFTGLIGEMPHCALETPIASLKLRANCDMVNCSCCTECSFSYNQVPASTSPPSLSPESDSATNTQPQGPTPTLAPNEVPASPPSLSPESYSSTNAQPQGLAPTLPPFLEQGIPLIPITLFPSRPSD